MTEREHEEFTDPREALKYEFARSPDSQRKLMQSSRITAIVRATRVANGLDILIQKALEAK